MESFKRILIPTDGSEASIHAAKRGVSLAKLLEIEAVAIYVLNKTPFMGIPADSLITDLYALLEKEGKEAIEAIKEEGKKIGVEVEGRILEGVPSQEIVNASTPSDIIVIATLGRTGINKLLLGNVAERVVRHAKCPVMVVRMFEDEVEE